MNLLIVLPCCGHKLLLATIIIALTLISERHLAIGGKMSSDVEKAEKRITECLKTLIVPSLFTWSHRGEPGTLVNRTPSQWILEFASNTDILLPFPGFQHS